MEDTGNVKDNREEERDKERMRIRLDFKEREWRGTRVKITARRRRIAKVHVQEHGNDEFYRYMQRVWRTRNRKDRRDAQLYAVWEKSRRIEERARQKLQEMLWLEKEAKRRIRKVKRRKARSIHLTRNGARWRTRGVKFGQRAHMPCRQGV